MPLTKGHPSYHARFQMHWESKILLNGPPLWEVIPFIRTLLDCRWDGLIKGVRVVVFSPLSTIYQLYRDSQFHWSRKAEKTNGLSQVADKLYRIKVVVNPTTIRWRPRQPLFILEISYVTYTCMYNMKANASGLFLIQSCTKFTFSMWIVQSNMAAMEGQDFS